MPSTGFYLFLPEYSSTMTAVKSVNALNGLLLISSKNKRNDRSNNRECQCPQRASTYFFKYEGYLSDDDRKCVNALNGLLLISSAAAFIFITVLNMVSMPSTGFYLFLHIKSRQDTVDKKCQCPQRASTYFFAFRPLEPYPIEGCVNALNGLLLISSATRKYVPGGIYPSVNALNGLLLISSNYWTNRHADQINVSMPSTGFYLFLNNSKFRKGQI